MSRETPKTFEAMAARGSSGMHGPQSHPHRLYSLRNIKVEANATPISMPNSSVTARFLSAQHGKGPDQGPRAGTLEAEEQKEGRSIPGEDDIIHEAVVHQTEDEDEEEEDGGSSDPLWQRFVKWVKSRNYSWLRRDLPLLCLAATCLVLYVIFDDLTRSRSWEGAAVADWGLFGFFWAPHGGCLPPLLLSFRCFLTACLLLCHQLTAARIPSLARTLALLKLARLLLFSFLLSFPPPRSLLAVDLGITSSSKPCASF